MSVLLSTVEAVADTRANVLLTGETGTGKTLLARALHQRSSRRAGPFVVVGCGSLPSALLESELIGHVRGAFTGAVRDKPGKFELADQGTIFLDEINSAPLDLQVKLLRVLQERCFERVGDEKTREVDVRVVAATNRPLEDEIAAGRFREDLYWRLKVIALHLPPLRERPRDVVELAQHFLERSAAYYGKTVRSLAPATLAALVAQPWPGNVRELENVIERAVLLASGVVLQPADLGQEREAPEPAIPRNSDLEAGLKGLAELPPLKQALEESERAILVRALELTAGSRSRAARMLDINRTTLFNKMRKYGLMEGYSSSHEPGRP
jgi:two-component system response regulator HydG